MCAALDFNSGTVQYLKWGFRPEREIGDLSIFLKEALLCSKGNLAMRRDKPGGVIGNPCVSCKKESPTLVENLSLFVAWPIGEYLPDSVLPWTAKNSIFYPFFTLFYS
jgi:hypothetical protein